MSGRRAVTITPGTAEFDAWLAHYRRIGSKRELQMIRCRKDGRDWHAWTRLPPDAPDASRVSVRRSALPQVAAFGQSGNRGDVEEIAARLERRHDREEAERSGDAKRRRALKGRAAEREEALERVRQGGTPAPGEEFDVVLVDDPFDERKRAKVASLRDDPVGRMAARKQLGKSADERDLRLRAARLWQSYYERAEIGGARAIDPSKDKVDGGYFVTPDTDARLHAQQQLKRLDVALGEKDALLVRRVLGEKFGIEQVVAMMGRRAHFDAIKEVGARFREALDTIVQKLGLEAKGRRFARAPDKYDVAAKRFDRSLQGL